MTRVCRCSFASSSTWWSWRWTEGRGGEKARAINVFIEVLKVFGKEGTHRGGDFFLHPFEFPKGRPREQSCSIFVRFGCSFNILDKWPGEDNAHRMLPVSWRGRTTFWTITGDTDLLNPGQAQQPHLPPRRLLEDHDGDQTRQDMKEQEIQPASEPATARDKDAPGSTVLRAPVRKPQ